MAEVVQEPVAQETNPEVVVSEETKETVNKAEFDKVLNQMHEQKRRAKHLEAELEKQKIEKLKEQKDWQTIAELKEKEAQDFSAKYTALSENLVLDKKFAAVKEAALKQGILPSAIDDLEMLDLSAVVVEKTSTGRINVIGAEQLVSGLKLKKAHWFESKGSRINPETPGVISPKSVGWEEVKAAETSWKKNPSRENEAKYKNALHEFQRAN